MTNSWIKKADHDHQDGGGTIMKMIYSSFKNVSPFHQEYDTEP